MIIGVYDNKTIREIQREFMEYYPYLKLEFHEHPHEMYEPSPEKEQYPVNRRIGELRRQHDSGILEIHGWHKTGDVEMEFQKKYGLNAQVYRLEGDAWIQTTGSDGLNLEEQNEIGRKATQDILQGNNRWIEQEKLL